MKTETFQKNFFIQKIYNWIFVHLQNKFLRIAHNDSNAAVFLRSSKANLHVRSSSKLSSQLTGCI